jgi:glycosyltransferase involved in cell wall biosynthesis
MTRRDASRPIRILHVNTSDRGGGAEKVAWDLFQASRTRGHDSWFAVGAKYTDDPRVVRIPNEQHRPAWVRMWRHAQASLQEAGYPRISRCASWLASAGELQRRLDLWRGVEDFHFPGTAHLLRCPPDRPEIVHAHNLHGWYFDLRRLPQLSRNVPVVCTLHDTWLLSGHCSYAHECERWRAGCGRCPDLAIYPAIRRDATARNWRRKRGIFLGSRLHVATPSRWLMQTVGESILAPAVVGRRIIPNGVDLSVFRPADRPRARQALAIPGDTAVLLCVANRVQRESRKGYPTLREALVMIAARNPHQNVLLLALGDEAPAERFGRVEVRFVPYQREAHRVAQWFQCADLYVHPAWADNFPLTVLEALACGVPVVATAVGGIPEQVKSAGIAGDDRGRESYGVDEATGVLVPARNANALAQAIVTLVGNDGLRERLGANAARDAAARFDLQTQVDRYLDWYAEILGDQRRGDGGQ